MTTTFHCSALFEPDNDTRKSRTWTSETRLPPWPTGQRHCLCESVHFIWRVCCRRPNALSSLAQWLSLHPCIGLRPCQSVLRPSFHSTRTMAFSLCFHRRVYIQHFDSWITRLTTTKCIAPFLLNDHSCRCLIHNQTNSLLILTLRSRP